MHSSRMRTAHISCHPWGGCLPGGCLPRAGLLREDVCPGSVVHPLVNRMTDSCKNITLPETSFSGGNNNF